MCVAMYSIIELSSEMPYKYNKRAVMAEKGSGGGDVEPATRAAGGMCDRFLTFLAKNLSVSRMKSIAEGPRSNGAGGHPPPPTEGGGGDGGIEEDEFAIPIERAEFDFQQLGGHGDGGPSGVATTVLEESAATTARGVPDPERKQDGAAAADGPVEAEAAAPAVAKAEETKVTRRTVTIKEDRPAQEGSGGASLERKKSLFRKRQASSVAGAEEQSGARVPRRSGLRPRMPQAPRVPSNINERSSSFIEERKKGFGGKPAPGN